MEKYLLSTQGLTKQYGRQKAVDHIDIHIKKGAIYGFIGRNGAGKTTTLKMISGLARPTDGEIIMFGYRGGGLKNIRSRVSCLIEAPGLYGNMSAASNLRIKCKLFGVYKKGYVEELLRIVGLEDCGRKPVKRFSLGMKQRLGIGLALLNHPKLLVLDEPINGLDPLGIQQLRELIRSFPKKGITVILSSHILSEIQQTADYIGIISGGRLGFEGKVDEQEDLEALFMEVTAKGRTDR